MIVKYQLVYSYMTENNVGITLLRNG